MSASKFTSHQFALAYEDVRRKIEGCDFRFVERKLLQVVNVLGFRCGRTHALIPGLQFLVKCGVLDSITHFDRLVGPLLEANVIEFERLRNHHRRTSLWAFNFKMPMDNWAVEELPKAARILEQLGFHEQLLVDLNNELLNTYIGNLKILPAGDGGCIDPARETKSGHCEDVRSESVEGKRGNVVALSETQTGSNAPSNAPPRQSTDGVSFLPGQHGAGTANPQTKKESMDEKHPGSARKQSHHSLGREPGAALPGSGAAPVPSSEDGGWRMEDGSPSPRPSSPGEGEGKTAGVPAVTNLVSPTGGSASPGVLGGVTNLVSVPGGAQIVPISWGFDGGVTKMVTAPEAPEQSFPPHPLSKNVPETFPETFRNGLCSKVRRKSRSEHQLCLDKIESAVGSEDMRPTRSLDFWDNLARLFPLETIAGWVEDHNNSIARGTPIKKSRPAMFMKRIARELGVDSLAGLPKGPPPL